MQLSVDKMKSVSLLIKFYFIDKIRVEVLIMKFCDKLVQLRREKGYTQEQFADLLSVSRQSVSKWESGQSTPELNKLIIIADIFGVTVDNLVREELNIHGESSIPPEQKSYNQPHFCPARYYGNYEYKSKIKIWGIPLIHIKTGYGLQVAKGIIAMGNISIGVISIGGIALGGLCFGGVSLGLIALAGCAIGGLAIGGFALGMLSIGGFAIGIYSLGGVSIAAKIAAGGVAYGHTALGVNPSGDNIFKITEAMTNIQIHDFILQHHPHIWKPFLKLIIMCSNLL